ncbi:glycosyltransferase [Poseidonibacter lekithochrous]|uniref:glycosyltransferase family 2 protein n=1 Tax=Poseidonibacter TaxID=2321187 RepID=UPI001C08B1B5|nr:MULTISPECIES: glycosyltransferase [Poseidonibacter]MBU3014063.1 glycosyltransferase [Poseidonibacter lekithochrous]MDO6827360.1 glycosyltransferase [Poseidonibacter sp. 1_MG-2023]
MFNKEKKRLKNLKKRIEKNNLFDKIFYLRTYHDVRAADILPIDHYVKYGIKEDRKPNKDFDPIWYKEFYKDVKESDIYAFNHYVLFGQKENRARNEKEFLNKKKDEINKQEEIKSSIKKELFQNINSDSYLSVNPDIKKDIEKGLIPDAQSHFISFGYDEIKSGKRRLGIEYPFFNEEEYITNNKNDVYTSAFNHFLEYGHKEFLLLEREIGGYYPFELTKELIEKLKNNFDEESYLMVNNDVKKAIEKKEIQNGFEHFIQHGITEVRFGKRKIHKELPLISESIYLLYFEDVLEAVKSHTITSPYEHFLLHGLKEMLNGIRPIPNNTYTYIYKEPIINNKIISEINSFSSKPLISIIMPVYNVDEKWIDLAIKSLHNQWYKNWELCIADDKSTKEETINYLKNINDDKIKIKFLEKNVNISGASNAALKLANGEYIALMDNDDELTPNALYEVVKTINKTNADFIYSDEDKLEMDDSYSEPHFKPDFAPDMFLSQNYISHLGVIRKSLIERVGGWAVGLEGSQDYDLYLKVLEHTNNIVHIPKVLYHWRKVPGSTAAEFSDKSYAQEAGKKALENAMKRRNIQAEVFNGKYPGTYKVEYKIIDDPLVSIIIPFKDKPELLKMCIESILEKSTYKNFEIIGISNNSQEKETFDEMNRIKELDRRINFYEYNVPFNYSDINNHAVNNHAKGEYILLLNNDIEIISTNWIEEMLMHAQRKDIGCVGAKLYYPNDTIQHAGVTMGILTLAGHNFKHLDKNTPGYMGRESIIQNISAVTAACLMIKKSIYDEVKGLNQEDLKIAFNDVDFCLRVQEKGYKNIYTPYCEAYHHESISRGTEDNPEKVERFNKEVKFMQNRHKDILENGDPFYNINLTLTKENFEIKGKIHA